MDRRSWPWKKKSSDKSAAEKVIATLDSAGASLGKSQVDKDNYKKPNYVQISVESYTHLTGLENQVKTYEERAKTYEEQAKTYEEQAKSYEEQAKTYEEQVQTLEEEINDLNEKLSSANSEITTKEELVKQHAKVAEEAVSGWEKAEAEALALKNHLESVTLAKLTVEDRAAHLDGALKECMRQIRNLKEEHEQKLQELTQSKNMQFDRMKHELETRIAGLDQELMRAEAENAALSRSLQERSNMLIKINEEKSRAEAEIELLKSNVESCEREINSLKYELHIVSKELEIRNEEKNMSAKTAEVANKQHMEGVKKIAKLEAECQRLRGLVRKKLPGPAALAQMKMEVESMGRDHGDTRHRRSPARPASPQYSSNSHSHGLPVPEFSLDSVQKFQKENEFLTERLLAMEEEMKMLKEALAKRNSELQTSRSICAKTASKLQSLEAQLQTLNQQKGFPIQVQADRSSSQNASNPPSMTSLSEDGNDDTVSCAESWASALISELSHIKEKSKDRTTKTENGKHLGLMDDFEEMEKLAGLSNDSNGTIPIAESPANKTVTVNGVTADVNATDMTSEREPKSDSSVKPSVEGDVASNHKLDAEPLPLVKLQSRISKVFESVSNESDVAKILEDIKHAVQEVHDTIHPHSVNCFFEEKHCSEGAGNQTAVLEDVAATAERDKCLAENSNPSTKTEKISQELVAAITQIHSFILALGKEATAVHGVSEDADGLSHKIEQFSATFNRALCNEISLDDFVFALSDVMARASELSFNFLGYKRNEAEAQSPDCIDKVALPGNRSPPQGESYSNGCSHLSDSSSNPEVPQEANILSGFESTSYKCSVEEFESLKAEKDNIEREFSRCNQDLETAKNQLQDMEQQLEQIKSELASSQRMNSLSETQLKCMAESYKTLEKRAEELESEVNALRAQLESLDDELETERTSHQETLSRCKDLEEQLQRNEGCSVCSSSAADVDVKSKQEKELAAAAEKLAECQETIFLLGRQLKSLRPQPEFMGSPQSERSPKGEGFNEEEPTTSGTNLLDLDQAEMDTATSANLQRLGSESPLDLYNAPCSASDNEGNTMRSPVASKNPRHRPTKSGSSTSSTPTPEKHSRGFSRFFSSKGKNNH